MVMPNLILYFNKFKSQDFTTQKAALQCGSTGNVNIR